MPGVASALRISSQFTSFRNLLPRSRNSGGGLFRSPARGKFVIHHKEFLCRLGSRSPGRLRLPFAATRPQPPELARPGDHAARHARVRRRSTSELGGRGERYSHSQHDAKVADIAATAARIARPVQAGRPWARCGNIDPRVAPSGRAVGKYFLACPCLRAVAVIGWAASLFRVFRQCRTPAQEDKVCKKLCLHQI